jgi:hypothetical protein
VPGPHFQGDVLNIIKNNGPWDMMIAHPPCTHLAVSGARYFKNKLVQQAQALDTMTKIDAILNMSVPEWVLIERLSNRRICQKCGAIYNIKHSPKPKVDSICDKCGTALYQRPDDTPEVIKATF